VIERCEFGDVDRLRTVGRGREQSEERFRSTDIAGEQHRSLLLPTAASAAERGQRLNNATNTKDTCFVSFVWIVSGLPSTANGAD
jgi:hypothetical protein